VFRDGPGAHGGLKSGLVWLYFAFCQFRMSPRIFDVGRQTFTQQITNPQTPTLFRFLQFFCKDIAPLRQTLIWKACRTGVIFSKRLPAE
jgi:hypothetical protein